MGAEGLVLLVLVRVPEGETVGGVGDAVGVTRKEGDKGVEIFVVNTWLSTEEVLQRRLSMGSGREKYGKKLAFTATGKAWSRFMMDFFSMMLSRLVCLRCKPLSSLFRGTWIQTYQATFSHTTNGGR